MSPLSKTQEDFVDFRASLVIGNSVSNHRTGDQATLVDLGFSLLPLQRTRNGGYSSISPVTHFARSRPCNSIQRALWSFCSQRWDGSPLALCRSANLGKNTLRCSSLPPIGSQLNYKVFRCQPAIVEQIQDDCIDDERSKFFHDIQC